MMEILLNRWATYLFLAWVAVCVIGNLWPRKRTDTHPRSTGLAPRQTEEELASDALMDDAGHFAAKRKVVAQPNKEPLARGEDVWSAFSEKK